MIEEKYQELQESKAKEAIVNELYEHKFHGNIKYRKLVNEFKKLKHLYYKILGSEVSNNKLSYIKSEFMAKKNIGKLMCIGPDATWKEIYEHYAILMKMLSKSNIRIKREGDHYSLEIIQ